MADKIQIKTKAEDKLLLELDVQELIKGWWDAFEDLDDHGPEDCNITVVSQPKE